jgi:threonine dehydrogenase-like Zn-dependent dehydrogenase
MRAAVWNGQGTLDVVERSTPDARAGWVRVRVDTVGICGTDLHFFNGAFPPPAGLVPGHEVSGIVDEVHSDSELEPGTPVAIEPLIGCGECRECREGNENRCSQRTLFGVTTRGGMAQYLTVPERCVWPLPAGVALETGALAEPLAVCVRGLTLAGVGPGSHVAVIGAGAVGALTIVAARAAGAAEPRFAARHEHQHALARSLGGHPIGDDEGFDVVVETVGGHSGALAEAMRRTRPGGSVVVLGIYDDLVPVSAYDVSLRELHIVGSNCYGHVGGRRDFAAALGLLVDNGSELEALITHRFGIEDVNEAFAAASDKSTGSVKVVVHPA